MVASWRQGDRYGGTVPRAFGDIGCAIRTARSIATRVGGDARRIVLLGHSLGGWGGAVTTLDPAASTPLAGECLAPTGSTRPAAFVGIAGAYAGPAGDVDDVDWTDLIGASRAAAPGRWAQADPLVVAARSRARRVPTLLIHGSADTGVAPTQTTRFAAALRHAGWSPRVLVEPGLGHMSVLTAQATFAQVARLVDALPR
jgi:pimeloyl-ACP methyl ester carboxylesterase